MALKPNQRKVSRLEVFQTFQDGYKANDALRIEGLQSLLAIRKKKAKLLERDKQQIEKRYGKHGKEHEVLKNKQKANLNIISGLGMELSRAKTIPDTVDPESWGVKGRVYDKMGEPLANAQITLYGVDGRKVPKVKEASSDVNGEYRLMFEGKEEDVAEVPGDQEFVSHLAGMRIGSSEEEGLYKEIKSKMQIRIKATVFVRASFGKKEPVSADSIPMVARPGVSHYRDIILNLDQYKSFKPIKDKDIRSTRFLGNSASRELHDLQNEKNGCSIDRMRFDHMVNFKTIKMAQEAGYDFCAYCFGKDKSKR
ncbi:MAG: hypothetical protein GY799_20650 [Desulfobulbaceae bacterium]|nr:hypothetical protein [Desulfobulbaceae bacterium]